METLPITYGYAHVSTKKQNLDRQLDALHSFGIADALIYKDNASRRGFNRPAYWSLFKRLKLFYTAAIFNIHTNKKGQPFLMVDLVF